MTPASLRRYRALDIEIDAASHAVWRDGEAHHVRLQTMTVLLYLVEHRHRLVSKHELLEAVWRDVVVTDDVLAQCIKEIRRLLGDDHRHPRFIRTVAKAGYQFIADVDEGPARRPEAAVGPSSVVDAPFAPAPKDPAMWASGGDRRRLADWSSRAVLPAIGIGVAALLVAAVALLVAAAALRSPVRESAHDTAITDPETSDAPPAVLTDNVEAYRAYESGLGHARGLRASAALADFQRALELDPEFAMARGRIGYTHGLVLGDLEKALPLLQDALAEEARLTDFDRLTLHAWYAVAKQDFGSAISLYQDIVRQRPRDVEGHVRLAKLLGGEERSDEALVALARGLSHTPASPELLNEQCVLLSDLRQHREALSVCRQLVAVNPDDANAHDSLGLALDAAGETAAALDAYNSALAVSPTFEIAVIHRANLMFRGGKYAQALDEFERYIQIAPAVHVTRGYQGAALIWFRRGHIESAVQYLKRSREASPGSTPTPVDLLIAHASTSKSDRLSGLPYPPNPARGHRVSPRYEAIRQGRYARSVGREDEALQWFRKAVSHRPVTWNTEWFDDCVAGALFDRGRFDEAIVEYERVLVQTPHAALSRYGLARAYERKGDVASARKHFERFLRDWRAADPDIPEIVAAKQWLASQNNWR